jgi:hypothetical protein
MKSIIRKDMKTMIHLLGRKRQKTIAALFMLGIALGMLPPEVKAQVTTVDITSTTISNPYVIKLGSGDYIIKGNGTQTANRINVENGYHGTITLDNVNIVCPVDWAPMRIFGTMNGDNNNPTTKVNLILKGNNYLNSGNGDDSVAAGLQVDQGAQIDISAIDPENNASGYLKADTRNNNWNIAGAAGIGGPCVQNTDGDATSTGTYIQTCPEHNGYYMKAGSTSTNDGDRRTTGGNIIITSGTIVARGGICGAGIGGGGWQGLYTGNVVITGGDVTSIGGEHNFTFTVMLTGPYSGMSPEVTTDRHLLSDEESITIDSLGNDVFSVTIHAIRESFRVNISLVADINQGIESADGPRVWTSDGQLHIYALRSGEAKVYALTGALVKSFPLVGGRTNSTALHTGFYVVITFSDGQRYKVVIQ